MFLLLFYCDEIPKQKKEYKNLFSIIGNKLEDVSWRKIDGSQLIELTLQINEGLTSKNSGVSMTVDPAKLQNLLYGQFAWLNRMIFYT